MQPLGRFTQGHIKLRATIKFVFITIVMSLEELDDLISELVSISQI